MNGNKIVIGVDQSYKCTGIAAYVYNSETKRGRFWRTFAVKPVSGLLGRGKYTFRARLRIALLNLIDDIKTGHKLPFFVCFERPRLFSKGHISAAYLLSIGALNAVIADAASAEFIDCFSVDTRAWRCAAVGHCKRKENDKGIPPEKYYTVKHFCKAGYKHRIIRREADGSKIFEHDIADAMGIAVAAAHLEGTPRLKEEN